MIFKRKNKFRPIYKQLINLNENLQNRNKLLQFKKKNDKNLYLFIKED